MPNYIYLDKNTGTEVSILRTVAEMELLPLREECTELTDEQFAQAKWERLIGGGIQVTRGANWGSGMKGYW